jgi:hypothetical protein
MKLISHLLFSQLNAIVDISENYVETTSTNSAGKSALELYADERTYMIILYRILEIRVLKEI